MRRVTVEVTAEDIAKGLRRNACGCPVALAAQRACPVFEGKLRVIRIGMTFGIGTRGINDVILPDDAADFVRSFDDGRPVKPFTFTVELDTL